MFYVDLNEQSHSDLLETTLLITDLQMTALLFTDLLKN